MLIVITGASRGIGKAFAEIFAEPDAVILLAAKNEETLAVTCAELSKQYPETKFHSKNIDAARPEEMKAFGNWCLQFGVPDIVINNVGFFVPGSIATEKEGLIDDMLNTNFRSAYELSRTLLPAMKAKKAGHIFNICSIASLHAYANGGSYSISKFAMLGFSKNLREELKPFNIKVTSVMPGAVYTDSWNGSGVDENRIMKPSDIAQMVHAAAKLSPQACVEEIVIRPQLGDL
ncbi:MAG: SDR family oxidoreductase [Sphingobacteriia bacterium]|nr:SDR family oxidoreductase [Sphingobacteriia bacterium]